MKRKAFILTVIIIIAVLGYFYTRPTPPVLSVDKIYNVDTVGETVLVNVTLSNVPECYLWMMDVAWDPYILQLTVGGPNSTRPSDGGPPVVMIEGPFMKDKQLTFFIINFANNKNGIAEVGCLFTSQGQYASGTGVIMMMNFTVVRVGTTSIEMRPPTIAYNQSLIENAKELPVDHVEVSGLVTDKDPPPVWANADFQNTLVYGEVIVLAVASGIIYMRTRPPPSLKRKAELQPIVDPEDQAEHD